MRRFVAPTARLVLLTSHRCRRLLQAGAATHLKHAEGVTALCGAAIKGHLAVVDLLLSFNVDTELACMDDAQSPLFIAASGGNIMWDHMRHKGSHREI